MSKYKVYIQSAEQISIQQSLSDEWMLRPMTYTSNYVRSVEPDFKKFLTPAETRRTGRILKRALVTSLEVIRQSGVDHPDAIITGTGLGCIENTELFLDTLCRQGEQLLSPTYFMQSTHNTISSLIGIHTKTHGYNVTYSHKGISFDCALQDAWIQFRLGLINTALVGGHDEMTPSYFTLMQKNKFVGQDNEISGETAFSVMLNTKPDKALCALSSFKLMYKPTLEKLKEGLSHLLDEAGISLCQIDAVMTGISGNKQNDAYYQELIPQLFGDISLLHYKHIFGESYTTSGLGFYAAACCLHRRKIPDFLYLDETQMPVGEPNYILLLNLFEGKNYSFTLLEAVCGR
jgi:3-oxoacyl-(acyl-carrier-protein) synthase